MDVFRIGDNIITVDGLTVYQPKDDEFWYACNKKRIGSIRLQALYLYLHNEEKAIKKRFEAYVDKIIKQLIL